LHHTLLSQSPTPVKLQGAAPGFAKATPVKLQGAAARSIRLGDSSRRFVSWIRLGVLVRLSPLRYHVTQFEATGDSHA